MDKTLTLNEQSVSRGGRWTEVDEALSERTAALREVQRQTRAALVEYFSILQEWAQEAAFGFGRPAYAFTTLDIRFGGAAAGKLTRGRLPAVAQRR